MALEPSSTFTVSSVTGEPDEAQGLVARGQCLQVKICGTIFNFSNLLLSQSGDSWQFLFCLRPRPEHNNRNLKLVTNIGKLDIVWRTGLCDR